MSDPKHTYKEEGGAKVDLSDAGIEAMKRQAADPENNRRASAASEQLLQASADLQKVALQEEAVRCAGILAQAGAYYQQPLADLKFRKPLEEMHAEERSTKPLGAWVSDVPTPGNVASCVKPDSGRGR
jgi:hypothetical protein